VRPSRLLIVAADTLEALQAALTGGRFGGNGPYRVAVVGDGEEKLQTNLAAVTRHLERTDRRLRSPMGAYYGHAAADPGPVALLFPGQGSQHPGMLAELCVAFPTMRAWFEGLDAAVADITDVPPTALAFPPPDIDEEERREIEARLLTMEGGAQLGFIAGLALHELLAHLGIRADAMLGHSNGEHAALVASGTFVYADRAQIYKAAHDGMLAARRLPPPLAPESSVAVSACPRTFLAELIASMPGSLFLAMDNSPSQVVLSGRASAVDRAIEQISTHGGICVRLAFPYAYHTPLFDGWRCALDDMYRDAAVGVPHTPLYSCAIAAPFPTGVEEARELAARQWTTLVRFGDTIERMYADGYRTFVEAGPGNKLTGLVDDVLRKRPHLAVSACSSLRPDLEQLHHLAAELFIAGYEIDARRFAFEGIEPPSLWRGGLRPTGWSVDIPNPLVGTVKAPEGRHRVSPGREAGEPRRGDIGAQFGAEPFDIEPHPDDPLTPMPPPTGLAPAKHVNPQAHAWGYFDIAPTGATPSPLQGSPVAATIALDHFALMQEFLAVQERVFAQLGAALDGEGAPAQGICCPFLQPDRRGDGQTLDFERRFDLQRSDPLLRDHSLGSVLPVIPFTLSMELAAEACRHLFGDCVVVASMNDVRAYRWLALDQEALRMRVVAEASSNRSAHVRLFEIGTDERQHLAFEALVEIGTDFEKAPANTQHSAPSTQDVPSSAWTADRFYADYAFHGPSFQGIREVQAIGGESIEAMLEVTDLASYIDASTLALDPALLDCAGQLVGLWLLERGHRDFGIFPFRLREFQQHGPTPPAGARVRARATVRWDERGATDADIDFFDDSGALLYRLQGFEQRYLAFPPSFASFVLGAQRSHGFLSRKDGAQRVLDDLPVGFLEESWGIWSRALAHRFLDREELRQWYSLPHREQARDWLLIRVIAKEAVRELAAEEHHLDLAPTAVNVVIGDDRAVRIRCAELEAHGPMPRLQIERTMNGLALTHIN
jgi:malonyl CoA-acyl carrier protein transacylase